MVIQWRKHIWARPRPIEPSQIDSLESAWHIKLPIQYKHLLVQYHGMVPEPGVFTVEQDTKVVDLLLAVELERDIETYSIAAAYERLRPHIGGKFFPFAMTHGEEILCFDYRGTRAEPGLILVEKGMSVHDVAFGFQQFLEGLREPKVKDMQATVLDWPPQDVEAWLDTVAVGGLVDGARFNWEVFAFTTARYATETRSLSWARVSLRVYGALTGCSPEEPTDSLLYSAMNLRAWMIRELGPRAGDPVLDPEAIVDYARQAICESFEEAAGFNPSRDLRVENIDKIRRLRKIKNALKPLEFIAETTDVLEKHPDLSRWLQLRSNLP